MEESQKYHLDDDEDLDDGELVDEEDEESSEEDENDDKYAYNLLSPDELKAYKNMMDQLLYRIRKNQEVTNKMNELSVDELVNMIETKKQSQYQESKHKKKKNKK